jgi:hypothetical protein
MVNKPKAGRPVLKPLAVGFSSRVFSRVVVLALAAILTTGRRTIAIVLRTMQSRAAWQRLDVPSRGGRGPSGNWPASLTDWERVWRWSAGSIRTPTWMRRRPAHESQKMAVRGRKAASCLHPSKS